MADEESKWEECSETQDEYPRPLDDCAFNTFLINICEYLNFVKASGCPYL